MNPSDHTSNISATASKSDTISNPVINQSNTGRSMSEDPVQSIHPTNARRYRSIEGMPETMMNHPALNQPSQSGHTPNYNNTNTAAGNVASSMNKTTVQHQTNPVNTTHQPAAVKHTPENTTTHPVTNNTNDTDNTNKVTKTITTNNTADDTSNDAADTAQNQLEFSDDNNQLKDSTDAFEEVIKDAKNIINSDDFDNRNLDKMGLSFPLSDAESMSELQEKKLIQNKANLEDVIGDATSDVRIVSDAIRSLTSNFELLTRGLERISNIEKTLTPKVRNLCDSYASIFKKFEGENHVTLSGKDGQVALNSLVGGIRRIRLYNSGISVNLRRLSLANLNNYYREANVTDFEYGKMFGAYYYMFSDLAITKYIIENLFPVLICGSNYRHWKDSEKLLKAISFQDFHTILWAASTMMYPEGVNVNFTCGEPNCGHITKETVDLSKLRLMNTDLINDQMYDMMSKNGPVSDEDLITYQNCSGLKRSISFEYGDAESTRKWTIHLKQASLYDYIKTGEDYLNHLRKECNITRSSEVQSYTLYNFYRVFKPWIESADVTVYNPSSKQEQTFSFNNDGTDAMDTAMNDMLDNFQIEQPGTFGEMMRDYILDTKITHICFFFPKCPKCGAVPKVGHNGFIPYDVMNNFFTLVLMKLLRATSISDQTNTKTNTEN